MDLRSRVTLDLQFDIACIEKELDALDQWDMDSEQLERRICLQSKSRDRATSDIEHMSPDFHDAGFTRTRPEAMRELRIKLAEYGKLNFRCDKAPFMLIFHQMRCF